MIWARGWVTKQINLCFFTTQPCCCFCLEKYLIFWWGGGVYSDFCESGTTGIWMNTTSAPVHCRRGMGVCGVYINGEGGEGGVPNCIIFLCGIFYLDIYILKEEGLGVVHDMIDGNIYIFLWGDGIYVVWNKIKGGTVEKINVGCLLGKRDKPRML